jgi:predicted short-subunit dehydrogenase-like oxidoreductase (DUF2520 family)
VVGAGRVGASLASWAVELGAEAIAIGSRLPSGTARELAGRLDCVTVPTERLETAGQELLLVSVPDPLLTEVVRILAQRRQAAVVLHTSGSRDASLLEPLRAKGSAVGSLHPLKAFPQPLYGAAAAAGVVFGIDGDEAALRLAERLADAWGGRAVLVPPQARLLYHFAATLAAGGVATLLAATGEVAARLGLPRELLDGYLELARGALDQAQTAADPAAAITGPVVRGDRTTVLAELEAVEALVPELVPLAVHLSRLSLRLSARVVEEAASPALRDRRELERSLAEAVERGA